MKYKEFFGKKVKLKIKNDSHIYIGWLFGGGRYGYPKSYVLVLTNCRANLSEIYKESIEDITLYDE